MKLRELYAKPIEREVNPAVSATNLDAKTRKVEIEEYVFTDEILNGLYRILDAIKDNRHYDHVGIWIDGYYGSGKSHFLKYLDYCITPDTREQALARLIETVGEIDPLDSSHDLTFDKMQLGDLCDWLRRATIDTCIFNMETSNDSNKDRSNSFLHVFWNEFNGKRGFNKFNIFLAQCLEKPLHEKGVFQEFKRRIAEGAEADWNNPLTAADIIDNELEWAIGIAKDVAPTLDKESIRQRILLRDMVLSIDRFALELKEYLKDKGDDYRLIFLADEVSQFINKQRDRYLNLQEIITKLSEVCDNKVWVACTAQQDLSEILDDCNVAEEKDKEGKIMGRFEVKVSLKGTQPEVITQKRILDKRETVKPALEKMFEEYKNAFGLQFKLPSSYKVYEDDETFVAYYPFIPYQFKLIMQVFNSFLNLGYVAREVKGNERSIIKVVHATAKSTANDELGKFISFDELFGSMFENGLQTSGQKAVSNAHDMAKEYSRDPRLARRVANTLFMVCNIAKTDKLVFPPTLDNVTSLLISDMTTPRLNLKEEVSKVIDFFCEKNIIRLEQDKKGGPDTYSFYSEEEMQVAKLIQNQSPNNEQQANMMRDIFFKYLTALKGKETYGTRSFSVSALIKNRTFLTNNNPDITVEFQTDMEGTPEALALQIPTTRMTYYIGPQLHEDRRTLNSLYWVCQVNSYFNNTPVLNEVNKKIRDEFAKRADDMLDSIIVPALNKMLDTCPILSNHRVMDDPEITKNNGNNRYKLAVSKHLGSIYTKASLVGQGFMPTNADQLRKSVLRKIESGDYEGVNQEMTEAEKEVEIYLNNQYVEVNLADVVGKFAKAPYGWDTVCTLYVVNELVRRHKRDYTYMNEPNVETSIVANRLLIETAKFGLRKAKAIDTALVKNFMEAWRDIFNTTETFGTTDSTQIFNLSRSADSAKGLYKKASSYRELEVKIGDYPFVTPLKDAVAMFDSWLDERDPETYFRAVTNQREEACRLMDSCKKVVEFYNDQMNSYKDILKFLKDNEDNFQFLSDDYRDLVTDVQKILDDVFPMDRMTKYNKRKRALERALEDVRKTLREEIRKEYEKVFSELKQIAQVNNVLDNVLLSPENTIIQKTAPQNILMLKNNLDTGDFYQKMVAKILSSKPKPHAISEPDTTPEVKKDVKFVSLNTKTKSALYNEEDIDDYLTGLRSQLVKLLKDNAGIMIVK